jgi:hypothetical protein
MSALLQANHGWTFHFTLMKQFHFRSNHCKAILVALLVLASSSAFAAAAANVHFSIEITAWRKKVLDGKTDRRGMISCPVLDTGLYKLTFPQDASTASGKTGAPTPALTLQLKLGPGSAVTVNGVAVSRPVGIVQIIPIQVTKDIVIEIHLGQKGKIEGTLDSTS